MNMPLSLCEGRDPKGLYKLARAGKIKGIFYLVLHALLDAQIVSIVSFEFQDYEPSPG